MLISGEWFPCPDDVLRPVVFGEVLSGVGNWIPVPFLLDTGADRTVLAADVLFNFGPTYRQRSRTHQRVRRFG